MCFLNRVPHKGSRVPVPRWRFLGSWSHATASGPGSCLWISGHECQVKGPKWRVPGPRSRVQSLGSYFSDMPSQLYWNHTSLWVFSCKFAAYFQEYFHIFTWNSGELFLDPPNDLNWRPLKVTIFTTELLFNFANFANFCQFW